jgi:hypothetical protein
MLTGNIYIYIYIYIFVILMLEIDVDWKLKEHKVFRGRAA